MLQDVPPGPVPPPGLDPALGDDVLLVVEVATGQSRRGHEGDATPVQVGGHLFSFRSQAGGLVSSS